MTDVHVVGGGPAGCFAAISALRNGYSVLVSEEHAEVGEPERCSGLISKSGLESLSSYVDYRKAVLNSINNATFHVGKEEMRINSSSTRAFVIDRKKYDELCAEKVAEEGGSMEMGARVEGEFKAKNIIGADGALSSTAGRFLFPPIPRYVSTMQGEARYDVDKKNVHVYFSRANFPGFFGWVIPLNEERARVGVGVGLPNNPKRAFDTFVGELGISEMGRITHGIIPASVRKQTGKRMDGYNVLLVGDAAGETKASTGGGVYFGCSCAKIAGEHADDPEGYEREWRARYGLDLSLHGAVRKGFDALGDAGLGMTFKIAKALSIDLFLSEKGDMDRPSAVMNKNGMLSYLGIAKRGLFGNTFKKVG
jgi:geranylgeranyl reductase family protein